MSYLKVKHNIEVAHRLYELEGKCENIHGHSMWVELKLFGHVNSKGVLEGLAFADIKKEFRGFLDSTFDHHLLLNENDPWARELLIPEWVDDAWIIPQRANPTRLPGLMPMPADPTTENLAKWIAEWAVYTFKLPVDIHVQETPVNGAGWSARPKNGDQQ